MEALLIKKKKMNDKLHLIRKKSLKNENKGKKTHRNKSFLLEKGKIPSNNPTDTPNSLREVHNMYEFMFMPELKR
jgi:hypothetical protein